MAKLPFRKTHPDPALARYPSAMAGLISLGAAQENMDYRSKAEPLKGYVPDLMRMVLDDDLNQRDEDDPAVWAPYHALKVIEVLGPAEAAEPLTACLEGDDEWISEELPAIYAAIGPAAIQVLQAYMENRDHENEARGAASNALVAVAQAHPPVRAEIIAYPHRVPRPARSRRQWRRGGRHCLRYRRPGRSEGDHGVRGDPPGVCRRPRGWTDHRAGGCGTRFRDAAAARLQRAAETAR